MQSEALQPPTGVRRMGGTQTCYQIFYLIIICMHYKSKICMTYGQTSSSHSSSYAFDESLQGLAIVAVQLFANLYKSKICTICNASEFANKSYACKSLICVPRRSKATNIPHTRRSPARYTKSKICLPLYPLGVWGMGYACEGYACGSWRGGLAIGPALVWF